MQILIIILALVRVRIGMSLQWYELEVVRVDDGTSLQILVRIDMVWVDSGTSWLDTVISSCVRTRRNFGWFRTFIEEAKQTHPRFADCMCPVSVIIFRSDIFSFHFRILFLFYTNYYIHDVTSHIDSDETQIDYTDLRVLLTLIIYFSF